jgi:hypothetical protein
MRVGPDNRWGYCFGKRSNVSYEQEAVLGANLARLDGEKSYFKDSNFHQDTDEPYYLPENIKSIFGIGPQGDAKSIGIVWSMDEKHTLESLWYANIDDGNDCSWYFYPYKIDSACLYYVKDGEVYQTKKPLT